MAVRSASEGILSDDRADKREELIEMLKKAYWMEIETVMSYITNSINPDGVRAQEIIESLQADIQEELGHAQQFAEPDQGALRRRPRLAGLHRRSRAISSRPSTRPTSSTSSRA